MGFCPSSISLNSCDQCCSTACRQFDCSWSRNHHEEVLVACDKAIEPDSAELTSRLWRKVVDDLMEGTGTQSWFTGFDISDQLPVKYSLVEWIKLAKEFDATVFIAGSFFNFFLSKVIQKL